MCEKSYYEILGIPPSADVEEIKAAFRNLSMQHHPDQGGDADKFLEVRDAYKILSEVKSRRNYDALLNLTWDRCEGCSGNGVRFKQKGFTNRIRITCASCSGRGFFPRGV